MAYVEGMLKKKRKAGFLVDAIFDDAPAKGFYARRGWILVPGSDCQYVYNLPKGIGPEKFVGVENRGTSILERENGLPPSTNLKRALDREDAVGT